MTVDEFDKANFVPTDTPFIAPIETDLILARSNAKAQVNQFAGEAIFAKYPVYKQLNDPTEPVMRAFIDGIRTESNNLIVGIYNETDIKTIMEIAISFYQYTLKL